MTFAFKEIDAPEAQIQTTDRDTQAIMQVLIASPDPAEARAIAAPMQADPGVSTTLATGTLADLASDPDRDWRAYDFVVFHTTDDSFDDRAAVQCLRSMHGTRMQCIAMLDGPVCEQTRAELCGCGVAEVLPMPTPATHKTPTTAQRRLTLSLPGSTTCDSQAAEIAPKQTPHVLSSQVEDASPILVAENAAASDRRPLSQSPSAQSTGKIITVLRARGGSGASTIAVNLALDLAGMSETDGAKPRVALIDLDIQNGSVGVLMDLGDSAPFAALLTQGALPDPAFLDDAMTRHDSGVDVLAAPDIFAPLNAVTPAMIESLLDAVAQRYDHILIDMPQAMMDWAQPVFDRAATALVVTDTSVPAIKRTRRLIDLLAEDHMTLSVQVVVNREKRPLFLTPAQKEAAALLGRPLDHWVPEDAARARAALDTGVPLVSAARHSRTARAIARLRAALFPVQTPQKDTA